MKNIEFTEEEYKIIHQAIRYYQIHGLPFNSSNYRLCDEILNKTFPKYYPQNGQESN